MKRTNVFILALFLLSIYFYLPSAKAGEGTTGDYFSGMGTQIGRGLLNVISSPAEIPCTMKKDMADKPLEGAFTGFGKGIAFMLRRILIGVSEVGTFVMPSEARIPAVCR